MGRRRQKYQNPTQQAPILLSDTSITEWLNYHENRNQQRLCLMANFIFGMYAICWWNSVGLTVPMTVHHPPIFLKHVPTLWLFVAPTTEVGVNCLDPVAIPFDPEHPSPTQWMNSLQHIEQMTHRCHRQDYQAFLYTQRCLEAVDADLAAWEHLNPQLHTGSNVGLFKPKAALLKTDKAIRCAFRTIFELAGLLAWQQHLILRAHRFYWGLLWFQGVFLVLLYQFDIHHPKNSPHGELPTRSMLMTSTSIPRIIEFLQYTHPTKQRFCLLASAVWGSIACAMFCLMLIQWEHIPFLNNTQLLFLAIVASLNVRKVLA